MSDSNIRNKKIRKIVVGGFVAVALVLLVFGAMQPVSAAWTKIAPIHINNTGGNAQAYYPVKLFVPYDSDMNSNFSDLRVVENETYNFIPYWIENKSDGQWCLLWFNATYIPANSWCNDTYYLLYGNASASDVSDGDSVFEFFDEFEPTNLVSWNYEDYGFGDKSNPVFVHDIDGDGQKEIILARMQHENRLVVLNHDGSHRFTFTGDDTNINYDYHAIAFADVNGDGKDEIIFGSDKVYAIDYNGNKIWSYDPETYYYHSDYSGKNVRVIALDAEDIDNDGDIETVALIHDSSSDHSSQNQVVDCIKEDGSGRKWRWGPTTANAAAHYLLLARLDQSSDYYYVIFTDASQLWCLKHDGTEQWHNTDACDSDMYMAVNVNESSNNLEVLSCGKENFCVTNLDGSMYWKYNTGHTQEFDVADVNNDGHYEIGVFNNYDDHLFIFSHDGNKLYDGYVDGVGWTGLINAVKVEGNWYFAIGDRLYNHNGCVGKCLKFIGTTKHFNYKHHVFGYSLDFDNDGVDELVGDSSIGEIEFAPWTAQSGCFDIVEESAGNGIIKGTTTGANLVTHNTADIGVGKVIRAKIRPDNDYGTLGVIFGYQNSSNFYHVRVENEDDELQIYEWVSDLASKRGNVSVTISTGIWYILEAIWSDANSIEAKLYDAEGNEMATTSATMTGSFSSGEIGFRSYNIGSYDVFSIRKHADPEPTAQLGTEQNIGGSECTTPTISSLTNSTPTTNSVVITWTTNQSADNRVKYSKNSDLSNPLWSSWDNDTTSVSITLTGLDPDTTYYYQAWSYNGTNSSCYTTEPSSQPYRSFTTDYVGGKIFGVVAVEPQERYSDNPILQKGSAGSWDEYGIRDNALLTDPYGNPIIENGHYVLYYSGMNNDYGVAVGRATFERPNVYTIANMTKESSNPVIKPSDFGWNDSTGRIGMGCVIKKGEGDYIAYLWGKGEAPWDYALYYATSSDGISWTVNTTPILTPGDFADGKALTLPNVKKIQYGSNAGLWVMYIEHGAEDLCYATSSDGLNWTAENNGNPIITASNISWASAGRGPCNPKFLEVGENKYILGMNGDTGSPSWKGGFMKSTNLDSGWEDYGKVVLDVGLSGEWDDTRVESLELFKSDFGGDYVGMLYFGLPTIYPWQDGAIGYTTINQNNQNASSYTITLAQGYNMIGWTSTTPTTSSELCSEVPYCEYVYLKNPDASWTSKRCGYPGGDFSVSRGFGCLVKVSQSADWTRDE